MSYIQIKHFHNDVSGREELNRFLNNSFIEFIDLKITDPISEYNDTSSLILVYRNPTRRLGKQQRG